MDDGLDEKFIYFMKNMFMEIFVFLTLYRRLGRQACFIVPLSNFDTAM